MLNFNFFNEYKTGRVSCVDAHRVFICYHCYCGFKDIKKTGRVAVVYYVIVSLFRPDVGFDSRSAM